MRSGSGIASSGRGKVKKVEVSTDGGTRWEAAPQSLSADETYAVTAFVLSLNDIVPNDTVMDRTSLAKVVMPNRNGFVSDPRPDVGRKTTPR